ncbi:MAG: hypothetical protein ABI589_02590 [Burkholderiales bacterium]
MSLSKAICRLGMAAQHCVRLERRGIIVRVGVAACGALICGSIAAWFGHEVEPNGASHVVFDFLFWGVLAGIVLIALRINTGGRSLNGRADSDETGDPWTDEHGVHHYFGDAFDRINSPVPGAHDRLDV